MPASDDQTPQWPMREPSAEYPERPAEYPGPAYPPFGHTAPYARPATPEPPPQQQQNSGVGKLMAAVATVALVVGGVAGGVGGYLVAPGEQDATSAVSALEQEQPAKQTAAAPKGSIEEVAAKVAPSVVQLQVQGGNTAGEGSGFVISDDGYIMTNNHVVEAAADGGGQIRAVFADGRRTDATVVGRDPATDVAVVKADGVSGLKPVELGRSDDLRVGQGVVAIGSPFELSGTVTSGIISSLNRPVTARGSTGQDTVMDAIQTDAAINPGNSGGPLVNMSGRVIGINSAIYSPRAAQDETGAGNVGIGFAIPIDQARRTADELIDKGRATQTYIGANVRDAPEGGAAVAEIVTDSPAEKAGLKAGDVVIKLDDRPIDGADELVAAIRTRAAGEKVTLTTQSGRTVEITLGAKPVGQ